MPDQLAESVATQPEPPASRWAVLALLGVAQLMVVLDATIVNVALPSAQQALHFSTDSRQWVVTAYALAFGSLLLLGGKLGDLFGRKWTFIAGLIGFAGASALGGLAQSFGMLVAVRALQGAFAALLAPSALALLSATFAGSPDRPKAFGIFGAIAGCVRRIPGLWSPHGCRGGHCACGRAGGPRPLRPATVTLSRTPQLSAHPPFLIHPARLTSNRGRTPGDARPVQRHTSSRNLRPTRPVRGCPWKADGAHRPSWRPERRPLYVRGHRDTAVYSDTR